MPVNFNAPVVTDQRASVLQTIRDHVAALSKMLDGEALSGTIPTGAIRYSTANGFFERYNGTSWGLLSQPYLPLTGGTLSGGLTGTTANFTSSLNVNGNAVWHSGNLAPSNYLGVGATAVRAQGVGTSDPGGGYGQGGVWVTAADLAFRVSGAQTRTVWHDGNFAPSTKQDASTAWNTSNFNPSAYMPTSGGTFSSTVTGTLFQAPTVRATGGGAFVGFQQRDATSIEWGWYAFGGVARLWNGGSDALTVSSAGNVSTNGSGTFAGSLSAGNDLQLRGGSPTVTLRDTDGNTAYLHCNSNFLYVLRGGNDTPSGGWTAVNNQWPVVINLTNNDMTVGGAFTAVGNVTAFSDRRLKKDVRRFRLDMEDILAMPAISYTMRNGDLQGVGVVAQDVAKVDERFVLRSPGRDGYLSVDYGRLAFAMVASLAKQLREAKVL